jgi:predicted patatin/cPLA2 family phospholipase
MNDKIYEVILAEVEKGIFTPDALKRMDSALDAVKTLEESNAHLQADIATAKTMIKSWERKEAIMDVRHSELESRNAEITKREVATADFEKRVAVAEAKDAVRKEVFETLFKNVSVRRKIINQTPIAMSQGGSTYVNSYTGSEETTETEE